MAATKCNNCGAQIPKGAAFCPGCGAPKAVEKPAPQPAQTQPMAAAPAPQTGPKGPDPILALINTLSTQVVMFMMIFLGIIIACIGGLIFLFASDITMYRVGIILNVLGCLFIGMFLLLGGIGNKDYDKFVRLGMILGGALTIVFSMSIAA